MRMYANIDLYNEAMQTKIDLPTDDQLDLIMKMQDAEDCFEQAMEQLMRTVVDEVNSENILASLVNSWKCVLKARMEAGY